MLRLEVGRLKTDLAEARKEKAAPAAQRMAAALQAPRKAEVESPTLHGPRCQCAWCRSWCR